MPATDAVYHPHNEDGSTSSGRTWSCALLWSPIPMITWLMPCIGHMGVSASDGTSYDFAGPFYVNHSKEGVMLFGRPTRYLLLTPGSAAALQAPMQAARVEGQRLEDGLPGPSAPASACPGSREAPLPAAAAAAGPGSEALPVSSGGPQSAAHAQPGSSSADDATAWAWDRQLAGAVCAYQGLMYNLFTNNCHAFVAHFLNRIQYRGRRRWNMVQLAAIMFLRGRFTSWGAVIKTWLPFAIIVAVGGYFGRLYFLYAYLGIVVPLLLWFIVYTLMCHPE